MPRPTSTQPADGPARRAGRPPATSRGEILAAAQLLIDRDGWQRLTVRRLAQELGVGPTTLYHHVRNKDDLLVALINDRAARTPRPGLPDDPRHRIVTAALYVHDTLAGWPWAVEVITADGFLGRLDEPAVWTVEAMVSGALRAGCSRVQAVDLFRTIWYYTVGEILVRAHSAERPDPERIQGGEFFRGADMTALPELAAIGNEWLEIEVRDTYRLGLEAIVDGFLDRITRT